MNKKFKFYIRFITIILLIYFIFISLQFDKMNNYISPFLSYCFYSLTFTCLILFILTYFKRLNIKIYYITWIIFILNIFIIFNIIINTPNCMVPLGLVVYKINFIFFEKGYGVYFG